MTTPTNPALLRPATDASVPATVWFARLRVALGAAAGLAEAEAADPATHPWRLAELFALGGAEVLTQLCANPSSPADVIDSAARRRGCERALVAAGTNRSSDPSTLEWLIETGDTWSSWVRAAASNPATPNWSLLELGLSRDCDVALARNPRSAQLLTAMARMPTKAVSSTGRDPLELWWRKSPEDLAELVRSRRIEDLVVVASCEHAPGWMLLDALEQAPAATKDLVMDALATNPATPPALLGLVAREMAGVWAKVSAAALGHPSVAEDSWDWVSVRAFAQRCSSVGLADLPAEVAEIVVGLAPDFDGTLAELVASAHLVASA